MSAPFRVPVQVDRHPSLAGQLVKPAANEQHEQPRQRT